MSAQRSHALLTHPSALVWKDEPAEARRRTVMNLNNVGSLRKHTGRTAAFGAASSGKRTSTCLTVGWLWANVNARAVGSNPSAVEIRRDRWTDISCKIAKTQRDTYA